MNQTKKIMLVNSCDSILETIDIIEENHSNVYVSTRTKIIARHVKDLKQYLEGIGTETTDSQKY